MNTPAGDRLIRRLNQASSASEMENLLYTISPELAHEIYHRIHEINEDPVLLDTHKRRPELN